MILVTGATGTIGSRLVSELVAMGVPARAMTRDPAQLAATPEVDVVRGDYDDPASLQSVVAGVDALFLLTAPSAPGPQHDLAMLDAARAAGVGRVVRLSAIGTGERYGEKTIGAAHDMADQSVRASGMQWTLLRPTTLASNTLWWADAIKAGAPIPNLLGDGRQGVVDPSDVAAVAAAVLASSAGAHEERIYTLTGPELLSVPDQAVILAKALGRPVDLVDTPPAVAREQMLAGGMDPGAVDQIVTGSAWARAGHNAVVTEDVASILGRPPTPFAVWVERNLAAFGTALLIHVDESP
jgi:uncharacterized protein YbjT (DUF2867 family)